MLYNKYGIRNVLKRSLDLSLVICCASLAGGQHQENWRNNSDREDRPGDEATV